MLDPNLNYQKIWRRLAETLIVFGLYFLAGRVGLAIPFTNANVSPVWPAVGIALGGILLFGRHVAWGVAAAAFLVNFLTPIPPLAAAGIAVGNTVGPLLAAGLLSRKSFTSIKRLTDVIQLILYGMLGAAVSAILGPAVLFLNGLHPWTFPAACLMWWLGDIMGILLATPLVVNVAELITLFQKVSARWAELALLLLLLAAGSGTMFRQQSITEDVFAFAFLPLIIWGAVRFGVTGSALTTSVVAGMAVWHTSHGAGPFTEGAASPYMAAAELQMFIAALSLSGLCLAALISERTSAEEALAREEKLLRSEQRYRKMIETTNDGVWTCDRKFRTTFANRQMEAMLGYSAAEMIGKHLTDFYFPEDLPMKREDMERRRAGLGEVVYNRLRHKDGSEVWALLSTTPVFDNGEFDGVLAMLSDVTLLRKTEEMLRRNEKLITAGRLAASISHEINNPLEAVINLLYLLKNQSLTQECREYVVLAERQIQRVSGICRRTLGFFRDTSAWTELSLADLMDDTLAFYEHELAVHRIQVKRDYSTSSMVRASRSELQQVFANLISNAIEAMGDAGTLTARISDTIVAGAPGARVEVEDTGSGISPADLGRIFEPFFTTKLNTGTGLGLWVAREIVEKHGGTILAHSDHGEEHGGTLFSITLPCSRAAHAVA
jgi:PAS domain S-box-containing protein